MLSTTSIAILLLVQMVLLAQETASFAIIRAAPPLVHSRARTAVVVRSAPDDRTALYAEGKLLTVIEGPRKQQLPVYLEAGDPYAEPASYLRDGEVIQSCGATSFAGQIWVKHLCDESERGVFLGECPKVPPFEAWSPAELQGQRWLMDADPNAQGPTMGGGRARSSFNIMPSTLPRCGGC